VDHTGSPGCRQALAGVSIPSLSYHGARSFTIPLVQFVQL
jgi:hypothetical protein